MLKRRRIKGFIASLVFLAFISTAGCNRVAIYHELSEEDANEMLVLLQSHSIKAQKKKEIKQNQISWILEVSEQDLARARELLVSYKLPRRKVSGLSEVYKDKGLIPTPEEQKARFLLALKGEIINSLSKVPDIVDVDVVLNVPTKEEFASDGTDSSKRPTASVVVRVKVPEKGASEITEGKIQTFVANAVEGLNPRDVTVFITYLPYNEDKVATISRSSRNIEAKVEAPKPNYTETLVGLKLDDSSKKRLKVYLLVFFFVLVVLSSLLIVVIVMLNRLKKGAGSKGLTTVSNNRPALEGEVMDEGESQEEPSQEFQEGDEDKEK